MKERGIIFNAEMVRAILEGRKTQTRRIVKLPIIDRDAMCELSGNEIAGEINGGNFRNSQIGQPGDRLWVRETWSIITNDFDEDGLMIPYSPDRPTKYVSEMKFGKGYYTGHVVYAADGSIEWGDDDGCVDGRSCWHPSIHMPRWASRLTLEITGVRVHRLRDITEDDAGKEGYPADPYPFGGRLDKWLWFRQLWDGIYPNQSFEHNPWVWVVEFKRVEDNDHG